MNGNTPYCVCPATHTGERCETLISPLTTPTVTTPTVTTPVVTTVTPTFTPVTTATLTPGKINLCSYIYILNLFSNSTG
jgi:hypothetical protein